MMNMLLRTALGTALFLCQAATAGPVELSHDKRGQALIVPLWTVEAGNDTLVSVRNNSAQPTAVKVRLIRFDGEELLAFNLYLDDDDTWAGALTATAGGAELVSSDSTCVLPPPDIDEDGLTRIDLPGLEKRFGHVEIVEMGMVGGSLAGGGSRSSAGCSDLVERFETGDWATDSSSGLDAPGGNISAGVQIIDVAGGGMISVPATALYGFTDIVQHTRPDSPVPNLSTAHGADTDLGLTESRVCTSSGCKLFAWERPVEAVASVLLTTTLRGDVALNPAINALTELVVTRPLKRYEVLDDSGFAIASAPQFELFDRDGAFIESQAQTIQLTPHPPPKSTPIAVPGLETGDAVVAVSFNQSAGGEDGFRSPVLGLPGNTSYSTEGTGFVSGHAKIAFRQSLEQRLTSLDGDPLPGEAAIGFVVLQVTNGTLTDPETQSTVLSNYRTATEMTRR